VCVSSFPRQGGGAKMLPDSDVRIQMSATTKLFKLSRLFFHFMHRWRCSAFCSTFHDTMQTQNP